MAVNDGKPFVAVSLSTRMLRAAPLYLFLLPTLVYYAIFKYLPIYGVQIAFRDYNLAQGILESPFVGLKHFLRFFRSPDFLRIIGNTISISLLTILLSFPFPILFALFLNQMRNKTFKKIVQTVSYAPYFISVVVLVGMMNIFLSPSAGLVNQALERLGFEKVFFMGRADLFAPIFVISGIWQTAGWASIIYLAALSSINPELHEAAIADGANRLLRIWHIDLPGILPTVIIMLILSTGNILTIGFEKNYLMQNPLNRSTAEVLSTYVYNRGIAQGEFSYASAIGLFQSIVNVVVLIAVNHFAKRSSEHSLF